MCKSEKVRTNFHCVIIRKLDQLFIRDATTHSDLISILAESNRVESSQVYDHVLPVHVKRGGPAVTTVLGEKDEPMCVAILNRLRNIFLNRYVDQDPSLWCMVVTPSRRKGDVGGNGGI
jgi:hypothetical protein